MDGKAQSPWIFAFSTAGVGGGGVVKTILINPTKLASFKDPTLQVRSAWHGFDHITKCKQARMIPYAGRSI